VTEAYPDAEVVGVDCSKEALDAVVAVGALYYLCADYSVTDLFGFADDLRDVVAGDGLLVAAHNHVPRDENGAGTRPRSR
jgi:hypothetical protein